MTSSVPSVYMDSCCFIDLAKTILKVPTPGTREPHIWYCRKYLEAARKKHVVVYTSTFAVVECVKITDTSVSGGPTREDDDVKALFKGMLMSSKSGVMPVMPTPAITDLARDLRWVHGITCSAADRVHLATALRMKASYFFTTDSKLGAQNVEKLNRLGLGVTTADVLANLLPDEYRQLEIHEGKRGKDQPSTPAA